jgi:hypothetical protein
LCCFHNSNPRYEKTRGKEEYTELYTGIEMKWYIADERRNPKEEQTREAVLLVYV